ncbi:5'/3'-nucleotidase SurE [Candidatus Bathyarchaeota archaeon]|nr:MAG: 5'/3'-nucleotidase SurE [Candidatus Bathyarchaeota archaeon]
MPTILLINDDGVQSIGLVTLKQKLEKLGEVIVVAPEKERSGIGKALTTYDHIKVKETKLSNGSKAYAITGTPADAFLLAVNKILKRSPDMLVAGINLGPNLGIDDFLNSGTLGAALEAAIHKIPAIAVSYCVRKILERASWKDSVTPEELEVTATIAQKAAEYVLKNGMPPDVDIISINVPETLKSIEVELTELSYKGYRDIYTKRKEGYKIGGWVLSGYPDDKPGTDIHVIKKENRISITPIKVRFPHPKKALKDFLKVLST